jgi:hypothetical protein
MSTLIVRSKNELNFFVLNLAQLIVLFALFISVLGLLDFFNIYSYNDSKEIISSIRISDDRGSVDYNFALLPVFFGIISIFYFLVKPNSKYKRFYFNVLLLLFSLDIFISGSRRGLISLLIILLILLSAQIYDFLDGRSFIERLCKNSRYYLISVSVLTILSLFIIFKTDYSFKIRLLKSVGSKNINSTKENIAFKLYKYSLITGSHRTFQDFYSLIWPTIPEDPDSGWGTKVHKTIFPLTGKNVEIIPNGSKGYLMDSTCDAGYYAGVDLSESYTFIFDSYASKGDHYKAEVYCFVSDSCDIDIVALGVPYAIINRQRVTGKLSARYNLGNKGVWQKLELDMYCNEGEIAAVISCLKNGVKNFSKLKGYIIFAYPTHEKISTTNKSLSLRTLPIRVQEKIAPDTQRYSSADLSFFPLSVLLTSGLMPQDIDPIRNWASGFIHEDTTYHPYKSNIVLDTISNSFIGDRVSRWEFSLKIFTKEYNWKQKIFGGGFNFLNWFGYFFDKNKTRSDYPHNPFLSVLLYSGIIGLILYFILMYKVFSYYIRYFKEYKILSVFFIITFYFSFFSAGSPFDPPVMGFFVMLPFFIHSVHKKKKPELFDDNVR